MQNGCGEMAMIASRLKLFVKYVQLSFKNVVSFVYLLLPSYGQCSIADYAEYSIMAICGLYNFLLNFDFRTNFISRFLFISVSLIQMMA